MNHRINSCRCGKGVFFHIAQYPATVMNTDKFVSKKVTKELKYSRRA